MMSVEDPVLPEYQWLVVVGAFVSFLFGFGTGANDVANAFGTSVGAKTLTLRQAVVIAAIFEFTGAMVLGRVSTSTIAGGIADINSFLREPEMFAYGMVCALTISAIWNIGASYFELNVSSTHSIIGAIIGFAIIYDGNNAVIWQVPDPNSFPPYKASCCVHHGVVPIIVSWFFSPVFTGLASGLLFLIIRTLVLRRPNAYNLSFWVLPPSVTFTVFICIYFVFTKEVALTANKITAMYSGPFPFSALDFPELTAFTNVAGPGSCLVYNGSGHLALQPHGSGSMTVQSNEADSDSDSEEVGSRQAAADMETTFGENEEEEEGSELGSEPVQLYAIPPKGRRAALVPASDSSSMSTGAKKSLTTGDDDWTDAKAAWIAAVVSAGLGVLVAAILLPILRHRANSKFNEDGSEKVTDAEKGAAKKAEQEAEVAMEVVDPNEPKWKTSLKRGLRSTWKAINHGTSVDIHEVVEEDELVAALHRNAEVFDPKVEYAFQYLQVFSAICVVFSHGAGEVGYMAGPHATVWAAYTEGKLTKSVTAPVWIVFIGAFGLVIGLATYGYKVTRAMGVRLAKLSPTRGFCAELATALVIMIASQYGLPTSSSQCITGGIIGVGLLEGKMGVNWKFFARQFASWVATLFAVGLGTAGLFAAGIFTPSRISGWNQIYYEDQVAATAQNIFDTYRTTMLTYARAANASVLPSLTTSQLTRWNATLVKLSADTRAAGGTSRQTVEPSELFGYLNTALSLVQSNSILTVGQVSVTPGAVLCNNNVTADIQADVRVRCPAPRLLARGLNSTAPF
ncbi:hypothetical protein QJQ45_026329 [Haematococcus lacustris]|nr:hypothetical protein QJQ45_026329 [Haematococcus lacustris]